MRLSPPWVGQYHHDDVEEEEEYEKTEDDLWMQDGGLGQNETSR
jgi:hypothetical protein